MKKALNAIKIIMGTTIKVLFLGKETLNDIGENI